MVKLPCGVMEKIKTKAVQKEKGREKHPTIMKGREVEVDEIYKELEAKHSGDYEVPKLRLWARMISSNLHKYG